MVVIRRYQVTLAFAAAFVAWLVALPSALYATPMFTLGTPATFTGEIQVGTRFQMVNSLSATAVGAFVASGDRSGGVTASDFTGLLYDSSLSLIEKVLIPTGTVVDADGFAYANFTSPHTLTAGLQYVVTAWHGTPAGGAGSYTWSEKSGTPTTDPNVTFMNTQFAGAGLGSPTSTNSGFNDFGGNLQITTIPEPTSFCLFIIGGMVAMRARRRLSGSR